VAEEGIGAEGDLLDQAAPERPAGGPEGAERPDPFRPVPRQQLALAADQGRPVRVVRRNFGEKGLDVDEFPARVTSLLQPVGVDQAERVVLGVIEDGLEEGLVVRHRRSPAR